MTRTSNPSSGRTGGLLVGRTRFLLTLLCSSLASCAGEEAAPSAQGGSRELPVHGSAEREWPRLSRDGGRVTLSWLESGSEGSASLRFAFVDSSGVGPIRTVAESDSFFRNWADFPSVVPAGDSLLLAHWLVRGPAGGYDYGVRVAFSADGGRSWSSPWIPHDDDSPTEHGFVTIFPLGDGARGLVWLDGRHFAQVQEAEDARMSLRFREVRGPGPGGAEAALDLTTCDCCQTDAALTRTGPVVVYRDRTDQEVRDISIVRRVNGAWTPPSPVHRDGWIISACPVNGPAVAAEDEELAVAWFTSAGDQPRVKLAFSRDAGASFEGPIRVDEGSPLGRVDLELLENGDALVSWLERGGEGAEIRMRRVSRDGRTGSSLIVASSTGERASGFPRMVLAPWGEVLVTWTVPSGPEIKLVAMTPPAAG